MTNIIFFGSSKYAAQVLDALIKDGKYKIKLVVTQSDAPVGREQIITPTAVASYVDKTSERWSTRGRNEPRELWTRVDPTASGYAIIKPPTLKDPAIIKIIKDASPTVGVMLDYGLLIPKEIIDLFPAGIINLHPSLLPKHRGAIPAVTTILEGDKVTGVTIIKIDEKFDQGVVIAQEAEPVLQDDTPQVLYDRLFLKAITLLLQVLPRYLAGQITPQPQQGEGGPLELRLTKASGRIDWQNNDVYLERFIRAMTPWPGAWTTVEELKNRFSSISSFSSSFPSSKKIVKILKAKLNSQSQLEILELQLEGKKATGWLEFKNGYLN